MSAKSDQVFQLSLTEIAFMIAFILMFLLGFHLYKTTLESKSVSERLAAVEGAEQKTADLNNAAQVLAQAIAANTALNPDEVISNLIAQSAAKTEVARLERLLQEQDRQITALAEIQQAVDRVPAERKEAKIREEVQASLLLAAEVRKHLEEETQAAGQAEEQSDASSAAEKAAESIRELAKIEELLAAKEGSAESSGEPGEKPSEKVAELIKRAQEHAAPLGDGKSPQAVKKENADLRGQIAFLHNKLNARGGIDYPPCWAVEQTGKIQMLFSVVLRENDLSVAKAWPASREQDAMALPGIQTVLAKPVTTYAEFIRDTQAIADLSRTLNCRYYVRLESTIADAVQSDRRRLTIEDSFYKYEVRR